MSFPGGKVMFIPRTRRCIAIGGKVPKRGVHFVVGGFGEKGTRKELLRILRGSPLRAERPIYDVFPTYNNYVCRAVPCRRRIGVGRKRVHEVVSPMMGNRCIFRNIGRDPGRFRCHGGVRFSFKSRFGSNPLSLNLRGGKDACSMLATKSYRLIRRSVSGVLLYILGCFGREGIDCCGGVRRINCLHRLLLEQNSAANRVLIGLMAAARRRCSLAPLMRRLLTLRLRKGVIKVLRVLGSSLSSIIGDSRAEVLCKRSFFCRGLLKLRFGVAPFSFFRPGSGNTRILCRAMERCVKSVSGRIMFSLFDKAKAVNRILTPITGGIVNIRVVRRTIRTTGRGTIQGKLSGYEFVTKSIFGMLSRVRRGPSIVMLSPPESKVRPGTLPGVLGCKISGVMCVSYGVADLTESLRVVRLTKCHIRGVATISRFYRAIRIRAMYLLSGLRRTGRRIGIELSVSRVSLATTREH